MAYKYAEQRAVTDLNKWCMNILHDVQKEVSDYFTFEHHVKYSYTTYLSL